MRTRCPHCETLYQLQEEELEATNGLASCFTCKRAFNAWKNETDDEEPGLAPVVDSPSDDETRPEPEPEQKRKQPESPEKLEKPAILEDDEEALPAKPATPPTPKSWDFAAPELTVPAGLPPIQPTPAIADPLLLPNGEKIKNRHWGMKLLAILLLLLLALGQVAWLNRDRMLADPWMHAMLTLACDELHCRLPIQRATDQLVVIKRSLSPDPENQLTLKLQVTIRNDAAFLQPLPDLQLTLTDYNNQVIVRQLFHPDQYRSSTTQLASRDSTEISLLIKDPGWQAAGFQIEFY